jgi:ATP-binding protein involved in chromosome partitioning
VQSVRESGDIGRPAVFQENTPVSLAFDELVRTFVSEVDKQHEKKSSKTKQHAV